MTKSLLFQGVTQDNHLAAVRRLLAIPNPERVIISVGFVNEGGLVALEKAIYPIVEQTIIVAGIRNGITSVQGLRKCLEFGCTTYVVDTGSRDVLFHPKVYVSRNAGEARLIVGSANLTVGGLNSNIEASLCIDMDLAEAENASLIADLEAKIDGMIDEYPLHVFRVVDDAMVESLFDSGRAVDESIRQAPTTTGSSRGSELVTVPRMNLKTRRIARHRPKRIRQGAEDRAALQPSTAGAAATLVRDRLTLKWRSKPLMRRHLTIPTGKTTNQTGSMLFGKGALKNIDQRHYFRDEVFASLNWQFDTSERARHIERADARFHLIIGDVDYGVFTLRLSHNTRTDTRAYEQSNSMTHLHWGEARHIVAHEVLLGRIIYLYRDSVEDGLYVLEID